MNSVWSVEPHADQYEGASGPRTDVVLGLDYGTCWTKAVIRTPFARGGNAIAIPARGTDRSDYFLPTAYRFGEGGAELCPHDAVGAIRESKLELMAAERLDEDPLTLVIARASTFLALAIRHARRWYMNDQRTVLRGARLDWHLHVGVPSAGYDDVEVRCRFELAARAAWELSISPGAITAEAALLAARNAIAAGRLERCLVVPEVVAEVVAYAVSPRRREGLHLMIDVGASTLDVCGFVLYRERGSQDRGYGILTARVERLGIVELSRRRLRALGRPAATEAAVLEASAGWSRLEHHEPSVESADADLAKLVRETIGSVVDALRRHRDPNSPHWQEGLPVFLCGGGAEARTYKLAVSQLDEDLRRHTRAQGFTLMNKLDLAAWGRMPPPAVERRLGVAYGLSFDVLDVGEIRPPHEIGDVRPHEQVPRRCGCMATNESCPLCHGRGVVEPSATAGASLRNVRGARDHKPTRSLVVGRDAKPERARTQSPRPGERLARALLARMRSSLRPPNAERFRVDCPLCDQEGMRWDDVQRHLYRDHQLSPSVGGAVRAAYEAALMRQLDEDRSFDRRVLCPRCNYVLRARLVRRHIAADHEQSSQRAPRGRARVRPA